MLHYCACGEKLSRSDISFQQSGEPDRPEQGEAGEKRPEKDRSLTYRTECALLDNVRQGNMNYQRDLEMAGSLSEGLGAGAGDPLQQAILSSVTFVSLCTRAAIEGGLSPDAAYTVGDGYIRNAARPLQKGKQTDLRPGERSELFLRVAKKAFAPDLSGVRKDHEGVRIDPGHQLL